MIRFWSALISVCLLAQASFGSDDFSDQVPTQRERPSLAYTVVNALALHVDSKLKLMGIQIEACTFIRARNQERSSYSGLGPCLFENFFEGLKTQTEPGVIYAWAQGKEKMLPLKIQWRPSDEGWRQMLKELLLLDFEGIYKLKNASKELPTPYKQSFIGRVRLTIPPQAKLSDYLAIQGIDALAPASPQGTSFELEVIPTYRKDGLNYYHGVIRIQQNSSSPETESKTLTVDFDTNLNVLRTRRTFKVEGKIEP